VQRVSETPVALAGSDLRERFEAPAALAPPPGNPRFPLVDGVRALAAFSVLFFHATIASNLPHVYTYQFAAGVPIFFLVSGFLLYRPFVASRLSGRAPIKARDFARRRVLRIVPAYWVALTLLAIYPTLDGGVFGGRAPIYYGFLQTWWPKTEFGGLIVAWSLSTEITFYLALPFYAATLGRLSRGRSANAMMRLEFAVLTLLSLGVYVFRYTQPGTDSNLSHTLLGTFDWFAIGMAFAVISSVGHHRGSALRPVAFIERHPVLPWLGAFAALNLAALYSHLSHRFDPYSGGPLHYLWALIAIGVFLPAIFVGPRRGITQRFLGLAPMAWLGLISYGVYLYHFSVLAKVEGAIRHVLGINPDHGIGLILVLLIGGVGATFLGAASYYIVELPFLNLKERHGGRKATAPQSAAG
jgi:peptidoglycan/LPS O-acetylase OafA/YrhL